MCRWFSKLFLSQQEKTEIQIKDIFSFLFNDYGFCFAKADLGDAVDKDGRFFFYGPLNAYFIYNQNVCINILYLVQRQDYEIFITDSHKKDQVYIRNGTKVSSELANDLNRFALEVKDSTASCREIYKRKI